MTSWDYKERFKAEYHQTKIRYERLRKLNSNEKITEADVYIVWECKTLQNNKALAGTTLLDGMYYELTYIGVKKELYFDAYKKQENICIEM